MRFPYRNDVRKVLLPYLEALPEEVWTKRHPNYPNHIAWVIKHIVESEDHWVHVIGKKGQPERPTKIESAQQLLDAYRTIRLQTDKILVGLADDDLDRQVEVPAFADGWVPPSTPTWRWLFHHVYNHETYHAGQIGVIARLIGINQPHF